MNRDYRKAPEPLTVPLSEPIEFVDAYLKLKKNRRERINTRELRRTAGIPGVREAKPTNAAAEMLEELGWLRRNRYPNRWPQVSRLLGKSDKGANGNVVVSASGTFGRADPASPKVKTKRKAAAPKTRTKAARRSSPNRKRSSKKSS
jgi:hypothetical protein